MKISPQQKAIDALLSEFDIEMDCLRRKFHTVLKKYEKNRVEHLKKVISQIKSL